MRVHPSFDFNAHGSLMTDFGGALNPDEGAQQQHAPVYSCSVSVYPFCPPRGASSLNLIMCPLAVPRLWVNQLEIMFSAQHRNPVKRGWFMKAKPHRTIGLARGFVETLQAGNGKKNRRLKKTEKKKAKSFSRKMRERSLVLQIFCQESELISGCTEFQFNPQKLPTIIFKSEILALFQHCTHNYI